MDQSNRTATLDKFRAGEITILAASDVAARGLDIPEVSHVFNFDVPWVGDDYVHRIGRTGRAGREGYAATLVAPDDLKLLQGIESVTGEKPTWIGEAPAEQDFAEAGKKRRGRGGRGSSSRASSGSRGSTRRSTRSSAPEARPSDQATDAPPASHNRSRRTERPEVELDEAQQAASTGSRRSRRSRSKPNAEVPGVGEQPTIDAPALSPPETRSDAPARSARSNKRQERQPRETGQQPKRNDREQAAGGPNSFHEGNLPAFLQRPVRAEKAAKQSPAQSE
jgi:superfamily II DNA/RNA helicase